MTQLVFFHFIALWHYQACVIFLHKKVVIWNSKTNLSLDWQRITHFMLTTKVSVLHFHIPSSSRRLSARNEKRVLLQSIRGEDLWDILEKSGFEKHETSWNLLFEPLVCGPWRASLCQTRLPNEGGDGRKLWMLMSCRELRVTGHLKVMHFLCPHSWERLHPALVRNTWLTTHDCYAVNPARYLLTESTRLNKEEFHVSNLF